MPFTPFHLGPGLAVKSIGRNYFSFMLFGFSQVIIDIESAYYLYEGIWPVHRFFHTYLGATFVLMITIFIGKPICEQLIKFWNIFNEANSKPINTLKIKWSVAIFSSSIGVYSHILLDSIMHSDIQPFAPFFDGNNLVNSITLAQLHMFCINTGIIGILLIIVINIILKTMKSRNVT